MKRVLICLHILMLGFAYVPAHAEITDSTKIGISVIIQEVVPCEFQFSAENGVGNSRLSYVDSYDCSTDSNSKKLHERADSLARQSFIETHINPNYVRVEETIE